MNLTWLPNSVVIIISDNFLRLKDYEMQLSLGTWVFHIFVIKEFTNNYYHLVTYMY